MKSQRISLVATTLCAFAGTLPVFGQTTVYETTRFGNNSSGTLNADFTLNNFSSVNTSVYSSAPGRPSTSSSAKFAATPLGSSTPSAVLAPASGQVGSILMSGTTYAVAISFPQNSTSAQSESSTVIVNNTDTGTTASSGGIDTFAGTTPAFQFANGTNQWVTIGYVTLNTDSPTFTFTMSSATDTERWYMDIVRFTPIVQGTPQFWDTGSLGGAGTWDTTSGNWNTSITGTGTQQTYSQAGMADFRGTAGTVTITSGGVTTDGGVEVDATGYSLTNGTLTLGSGPTVGTNIWLTSGVTLNVGSVLAGNNGMNLSGGTVALYTPVSVTGVVTVDGGAVQFEPGVSQTFSGLTGDGSVKLGANTLTLNGSSISNIFFGNISDTGGPGAVVITGSGTNVFAGQNTYTGKTTITGSATLAVNSDASLGIAPSALVANQLTMSGGSSSFPSLVVYGTSVPVINAKRGITITGTNVIAGTASQKEITLNCPITGTGTLLLPYTYPDFNAINTFTGDLFCQLTNGLSIRFNSNNSAGAGTIHIMPLTPVNTPCTLRNFSPTGITTTIPNAVFFDESVTNAQNYNLDTAGATGTFILTGNISGTTVGGVNVNDNPNGGGNIVLSGNNSAFSGGFNLQGGTLTLGSATALGSGIFVVNESDETIWTTMKLQASIPLTGSSAITNSLYLNAPGSESTLIIQGANEIQFAGPVHIGGGGGVAIEVNSSVPAIISGNIDDQGLNLGLTFRGHWSSHLAGLQLLHRRHNRFNRNFGCQHRQLASRRCDCRFRRDSGNR